MKNWIILLSLFCIACGNNLTKENSDFQLKVGDILFQDLDSSPLCDAIELVTPGYKGANFSHIGMVVELGDPYCINPDYNYIDHVRILEAFPTRVRTIRVDSFLNRSLDNNGNPKVIVGRLKVKYTHTIFKAIEFANKQLGKPYDEEFLMKNKKYYCSELIYESFESDNIFELQPMTFLHPETKDTLKVWKKYYSDLGVKIPQNKLGINPGIMSLSDKIEVVHIYGIPENFTE